MAAVAAEYQGQVEFVGMAGRGHQDDMRAFVSDTGTDGLTHVVDDDGALWQRFDVFSQPAFAFVDADGQARTFAGGMDADSLREAVEELQG